jgi:integrase
LMFPGGWGNDLTKLRDAHAVTRLFKIWARKLGFPNLRFHDLRGSHETLLLDNGVPVHVVAARCGHDPAVLLRAICQENAQSGYRRRGRDQHLVGRYSRSKINWVELGSKQYYVPTSFNPGNSQ